jgi:hypothetical protein
MMKRAVIFIIAIVGFSLPCLADSIILKKGGYETKGLILDNFCDRIVVSTFRGEEIINKDKIEKITFDDEDRKLVYKAQNLLEEEQMNEETLDKAKSLFQEALRLNSNNRDAEKGLSRVIDERLKLKNPQIGFLGMTLGSEGDVIKVTDVVPRSPAGMGEVRPGDILYSVWDKKIRYDNVETIIRLLSGPPDSAITFAIEREVAIGYSSNAAHNLKKVLLVTAEGIFPKLNGIEDTFPTDRIVAVCGKDARFITGEYLSRLSANFKDKNIIVTIRRVFDLKRGSFELETGVK